VKLLGLNPLSEWQRRLRPPARWRSPRRRAECSVAQVCMVPRGSRRGHHRGRQTRAPPKPMRRRGEPCTTQHGVGVGVDHRQGDAGEPSAACHGCSSPSSSSIPAGVQKQWGGSCYWLHILAPLFCLLQPVVKLWCLMKCACGCFIPFYS
jgi:hypothetical protein